MSAATDLSVTELRDAEDCLYAAANRLIAAKLSTNATACAKHAEEISCIRNALEERKRVRG